MRLLLEKCLPTAEALLVLFSQDDVESFYSSKVLDIPLVK